MKKHQKNKGFTLVEVIVVAVIVAILAAVAIPLYTGYVNDSRVSLANSTAGSVASFLAAERNTGGTPTGYTSGGGTIAAGATVGSGTKAVTIPAKVTVVTTGTMAAGGTVKASHSDGPASTDAAYVSYSY